MEREPLFGRVLAPLDGSPAAESVLPAVRAIGARFGSTVVLLHVLELHPPERVHGERHMRTASEAQEYLQGLAEGLRAVGIRVELHVHAEPQLDVAQSIVQHVGEHATDLTALCAHGPGGLHGLLHGSIGQQVLGKGSGCVLLLRPPSGFEVQRVLLPTDGGELHAGGRPVAACMARAFAVPLSLLFVEETLGTIRGEGAAASRLFPATAREMLGIEAKEAVRRLEAQAEALRAQGIEADVEVAHGYAPAAIAGEAARLPGTLLVMATHGRAGLDALFAGSAAAQTVSRFCGPVLLVKAEHTEG